MNLILKRTLATLSALKPSPEKLSNIVLTGRDYILPNNLCGEEVKSILWTAMDLKHCMKQNCQSSLCSVQNSRITLLLEQPCTKTQLAMQNIAKMMDLSLNIIINDTWDKTFESEQEDYGRLLACYSDIIFCKNRCQEKIQKIADGSNKPVISIETYEFSLVKVLADLMTLQLRYNHLKGLTLAWVGEHGPIINTYLCMLPTLGLNIKYYCVDSSAECVSPSLLSTGIKLCQKSNSEIHECRTVKDVTYRVDVIATASHKQEKLMIKMEHVKEAAVKWGLLSTLPRQSEVEKDVLKHKNSLVWKSMVNMEWIFAAMIIRFLKNHEHIINVPSFDDIEAGFSKKKCK